MARWYDPVIAHFAQADTEAPQLGQSQTFDRYMYANQNPIRYNDPTGHDAGCGGMDCSDVSSYSRWSDYTQAVENYYQIAPIGKSVKWNNESEPALASKQQYQGAGRNDCALISITVANNLLLRKNLAGSILVSVIDKFINERYRTFPNYATLPWQQVNIINDYFGPDLNAQLDPNNKSNDMKLRKSNLINNLSNPNMLQLVTFIWVLQIPPQPKASDADKSQLDITVGSILGGGHTMILGAYDPNHKDKNGASSPWGFINSWTDGGKSIYWMPDQEMKGFTVVDVNKAP